MDDTNGINALTPLAMDQRVLRVHPSDNDTARREENNRRKRGGRHHDAETDDGDSYDHLTKSAETQTASRAGYHPPDGKPPDGGSQSDAAIDGRG